MEGSENSRLGGGRIEDKGRFRGRERKEGSNKTRREGREGRKG